MYVALYRQYDKIIKFIWKQVKYITIQDNPTISDATQIKKIKYFINQI